MGGTHSSLERGLYKGQPLLNSRVKLHFMNKVQQKEFNYQEKLSMTFKLLMSTSVYVVSLLPLQLPYLGVSKEKDRLKDPHGWELI